MKQTTVRRLWTKWNKIFYYTLVWRRRRRASIMSKKKVLLACFRNVLTCDFICLFNTRMRRKLEYCQKQPLEAFYEKSVLKNFTKFKGKHLYQSLSFYEVAGLSCEFCEISKNNFLQNSSERLLLYCHDFRFITLKVTIRWQYKRNNAGEERLCCMYYINCSTAQLRKGFVQFFKL